MAVTRRSADFARVAERVDQELIAHGLAVPGHVVDAELNRRISAVGQLMGTTPRAVLVYAPTDLAQQVAEDIVEAIRTLPGGQPPPDEQPSATD